MLMDESVNHEPWGARAVRLGRCDPGLGRVGKPPAARRRGPLTDGPRAAAALLPRSPGVYRFRDARGRVLYIGRAVDLRRRVQSYWSIRRERPHLSAMVVRITRLEAVACDSEHEAAWLERNLMEESLPPWNATPGGQEASAYIRLDTGAGAPQITFVHTPRPGSGVHHFGPYLGGSRVRLAISALGRVLPLAYAGEDMIGFGRDMARARRVGPHDRDVLIERVSAVLERRPVAIAALRAELLRRRNAAAKSLDFELAARLRDEIEAVDWVCSEQKATLAEPVDLDIHGWTNGVLVRFQVRAGRLCGWQQQTCAEPKARPLVAATPVAWATFALRNAELAARLTDPRPRGVE